MELEKVLEILIAEFNRNGVRYALMGGYALGLLGVPRATVDLDFLVRKDDMPAVDAIMRSLEYEKRYDSEDVTQYVAVLRIFGEVDFIHAFREISTKMLQRATGMTILGGRLTVEVLRPEDIIGLKVQAIANNPERRGRDLDDIEGLCRERGGEMDWDLLATYFALFDMTDTYDGLRREYGTSD